MLDVYNRCVFESRRFYWKKKKKFNIKSHQKCYELNRIAGSVFLFSLGRSSGTAGNSAKWSSFILIYWDFGVHFISSKWFLHAVTLATLRQDIQYLPPPCYKPPKIDSKMG